LRREGVRSRWQSLARDILHRVQHSRDSGDGIKQRQLVLGDDQREAIDAKGYAHWPGGQPEGAFLVARKIEDRKGILSRLRQGIAGRNHGSENLGRD
jgi:hypothetical protein